MHNVCEGCAAVVGVTVMEGSAFGVSVVLSTRREVCFLLRCWWWRTIVQSEGSGWEDVLRAEVSPSLVTEEGRHVINEVAKAFET